MNVNEIAADLAEEQQVLDGVVQRLDDAHWQLATPSPRWTVADQIGHLVNYDSSAVRAITDQTAFMADVNRLLETAPGGDEALDALTLSSFRAMPPSELLERWRHGRHLLADAATTLSDDTRVNWYGPPMGAKSFLTARLMEVWAHGQDIVDALGVTRAPSHRLRHIAQLGFITRGWSYSNQGRVPPTRQVRVELTWPSGLWRFGPEDTDEFVAGAAEDFCLVVTQRRHLDDTALETSPLGRDWMLIAQAFAGPPTDGPAPGTRV